MNEDEWRVEIDLDDEEHGYSFGERLRALDLDDEARGRLGGRVIVTRDGSRVFLYTRSAAEAAEAARVAKELLEADRLTADVRTTRWHPLEQAWRDATEPLPRTAAEREAELARREEHERREVEEEGSYDWHVKVSDLSLDDARELEQRLGGEGHDVDRLWTYLTIGVLTEEHAVELADRLRGELPKDADVRVEPNLDNVPSPLFVFVGSWL